MNTLDLPERFQRRITVDPSGCWLWDAVNWAGYCQTLVLDGSKMVPHRATYLLLVGVIRDGLDLDHLCRVRNCVNPKHLEPVTRSENLRRSSLTGKHRLLTTHCPKGHPYDSANTYPEPGGGRGCFTCRRAASAAFYRRTRTAS